MSKNARKRETPYSSSHDKIQGSESHVDSLVESVERLSPRWQFGVLLWIAFHLLAVFIEPFHFFSRSEIQTAPDAQLVRSWMKPYSQWLFLDHGYFFFAPNPGPGHLLRAVVSDDPIPPVPDDRRPTPMSRMKEIDGADVTVVTLPDRSNQWPRLLYHRYLMFSEFYYSRYAPRDIGGELLRDADLTARWKRDREIYLNLQRSLSQQAKDRAGKQFVRIDRLERGLPDLRSVKQRGLRITDLQWVSILPETLDLPESIPQSDSPSAKSEAVIPRPGS